MVTLQVIESSNAIHVYKEQIEGEEKKQASQDIQAEPCTVSSLPGGSSHCVDFSSLELV